jgi:hypothetical protein
VIDHHLNSGSARGSGDIVTTVITGGEPCVSHEMPSPDSPRG